MSGSKKHLDLVIGIPSGPEWKAQMALCLMYMTAHLVKPIPGYDTQNFRISNVRSSGLSGNRERIVQYAMGCEATHLLFIDSDMTFPKDTATRLLAHDKPVVGCNCATKTFPSCPTARVKSADSVRGKPQYSTPTSPNLERTWRVGTGILLLDMQVFRRIKAPRFEVLWEPRVHDYTGEDWYLCKKLEKAGYQLWVDHDLSMEIGHIGNLTYEHDIVQIVDEQEAV